MSGKFALYFKRYVEHNLARLLGKLFWPVSSVAVIVRYNEEQLVVLDLGGSYRLPGGIIGYGENVRDSAIREVKEETGLKVRVKDILDVRMNDGGGPEIFLEAEAISGKLTGSWEGQPKIIDVEEIDSKEWKYGHGHIQEYL